MPSKPFLGTLKTAGSGVLDDLPSSRTGLYAPGVKPSTTLPEEKHVLACTSSGRVRQRAFLNIPSDFWCQILFSKRVRF